MAKCSECGAPIAAGMRFCGYCGAGVAMDGSDAAAELLDATTSIAADTSRIVQQITSPTSDSFLNSNSYRPVMRTRDGRVALTKLSPTEQWPGHMRWTYVLRDEGGDQYEVGLPVVFGCVTRDEIDWLDAPVRCPDCARTYHLSRSVWFTPRVLMHLGNCPVCRTRDFEQVVANGSFGEALNAAGHFGIKGPSGLFAASAVKKQFRQDAVEQIRALAAVSETPIGSWSEMFDWNLLLRQEHDQLWRRTKAKEFKGEKWNGISVTYV